MNPENRRHIPKMDKNGGIPERIESEKMGTTKKDQKGELESTKGNFFEAGSLSQILRQQPNGIHQRANPSKRQRQRLLARQIQQCLKRGQKGKASLQPRISAIWL